MRSRHKANRVQRGAHGLRGRVGSSADGPVSIARGHGECREVQRLARRFPGFFEQNTASPAALIVNSGIGLQAGARPRVHDGNSLERQPQIGRRRLDDSPATQ
jgi:hypothetical protein